jgi:hypothetical protein
VEDGASPQAAVLRHQRGHALLSRVLPDHPETLIEVTAGGRHVRDPHVIALWAQNWSRTDIRAADFDEGIPLVFDLGVTILHLLDPEKLRED